MINFNMVDRKAITLMMGERLVKLSKGRNCKIKIDNFWLIKKSKLVKFSGYRPKKW